MTTTRPRLNDDTTDTTTCRDDQNTRAAAMFSLQGINAPTCPRALAAKPCHHPEPCLCHHPALDHARRWRDPDGNHLITGEPYNLNGEDLAHFIRACTDLGLTVTIDGRSPWNPSDCLTVLIRRPPKPHREPGPHGRQPS